MRLEHFMKITTVLALLAFAAPAAFAQQPTEGVAQQPKEGVAQLKQVKGNVLVSGESGLASGDEARRLAIGTRVITTANGEAIVAYDNGCEVSLKPNQRFEVQEGKSCKELMAQAASILVEPAGAAVAGASGGLAAYAATLPALGGGLVGLGILTSLRENQSVSPN